MYRLGIERRFQYNKINPILVTFIFVLCLKLFAYCNTENICVHLKLNSS